MPPSSSTRTRPQHYAPGPLKQKLNQISPKSTLDEHKDARSKAEDDVKKLLGPQGCERLVSPALPATPTPARVPLHGGRAGRGGGVGRAYKFAEKQEALELKAKRQRNVEAQKVAKKKAKKDEKKAAKEKKAEGKARRGSKREKVSEEQVQKKRARFEQKSGGARKSSQ